MTGEKVMPVERHFISWEEPLVVGVRRFLAPAVVERAVDLGDTLVIVPTQQAGRRLRESLAAFCAGQGGALLSARVVQPSFLFRHGLTPERVAPQSLVSAVWADLLMSADLDRMPALFPARQIERDFAWALATAEQFQAIRTALAEQGLRAADVPGAAGDALEESERWEELGELERIYLERIVAAGHADPCESEIRQASAPELRGDVRRVVVACVPDPPGLALNALRALSIHVPVHVLVHAPEEMACAFDEWGRPLPEFWLRQGIPIEDPERDVLLAGSPRSQARRVAEQIAAGSGRFGPCDIAIGVPDRSAIPFLEDELNAAGLETFNPSGCPVSDHPLHGVIAAYRDLVVSPSYEAVASFLRHPDVLACLAGRHGTRSADLLMELDAMQNYRLPSTLDDMLEPRPPRGASGPSGKTLETALSFVREQVRAFASAGPEQAVRAFLQTVYEGRSVDSSSPDGAAFLAVADAADSALRDLGSACAAVAVGKADALDLLLRGLAARRFYPERMNHGVDLEGWLELPWNDAPLLIVTGMNEGAVPDGRLGDAFLPDSLRRRLGLRCDASRDARDSYLMRAMIESRRSAGRACFVAAKTGVAGDPLRPSRLLFRCADSELPKRASRLFGAPDEIPDACPATVSFRLDPSPPPAPPPGDAPAPRVSVTALADYLACPFRYYLAHVLGMEEMDDRKREMDAMDFGLLGHHALSRMAAEKSIRSCRDAGRIAAFLAREADAEAARRFGRRPPLPVRVQVEAAKRRLGAAADAQAALCEAGWQIMLYEEDYETDIEGTTLRARIDRVDRHRKTGRLRILDYKTSDIAESPVSAHVAGSAGQDDYRAVTVGGKTRRWVSLQLPLYAALLGRAAGEDGPFEIGYFNLPAAAAETKVVVWDPPDPGLPDCAMRCAREIAARIRGRVFWPPAERVQYESFAPMFWEKPDLCVDSDRFMEYCAHA